MSDLPAGSWRKHTDSRGVEYYVIFVPGDERLPMDARVRVVKADGRVKISRVFGAIAAVPGGHIYHPSSGGGRRRVR